MHQHGPNCRHGHGHGHQDSHEQSNFSKYQDNLRKMWHENREFFWVQVLNGSVIDQLLMKYHLIILRLLNCLPLAVLVNSLENYLSFQFLPNQVKPISAGMFFPIAAVFWFNYSVINEGFQTTQTGVIEDPLLIYRVLMYVTLTLYLICAFRSSGNLLKKQSHQKSKEGIRMRPYLQSPGMNCAQCQILKVFRAVHCANCRHCVPKYSRHSLLFNQCIGAANQLGVLIFLFLLSLTGMVSLILFIGSNPSGYLNILVMVYLNWFIFWNSLTEFFTLFILNLYYGVTEYELKNWMANQYLHKLPMKQFQNNVNCGFWHNLTESAYAFFGLEGIEGEMLVKRDMLQDNESAGPVSDFKKLDSHKKYHVNWNLAFFYVLPLIPNHPSRELVMKIMAQEEPKLIENCRLREKFKNEVLAESKQPLSDAELQQRVMAKLHAHMIKNNPQGVKSMGQMGHGMPHGIPHGMGGSPPTPQQQRSMLVHMISTLCKQLQGFPQIAAIQNILQQLKSQKITPMQANMQLRPMQQDIMRMRMQKMMRDQQMPARQPSASIPLKKMVESASKGEDQTECLKREEEIMDD